jgi:hypothetical protein
MPPSHLVLDKFTHYLDLKSLTIYNLFVGYLTMLSIASNDRIINAQWIRNYVEGSGRGLI